MAKILQALPVQSYEAIRDRIAAILADELSNQFVFTYDDVYQGLRVYIERFKAFNLSQLPAINVQLFKGTLESEDAKRSTQMFTYIIDAYTSGKSTDTQDGDTIAMMLNQRLLGNVRAILRDTRHYALSFTPGFVLGTKVASFQWNNPESSKDGWSVAHGRIVFEVRAGDLNGLALSRVLGGWGTKVKMHESESGYRWFGDPESVVDDDAGGFEYELNFDL